MYALYYDNQQNETLVKCVSSMDTEEKKRYKAGCAGMKYMGNFATYRKANIEAAQCLYTGNELKREISFLKGEHCRCSERYAAYSTRRGVFFCNNCNREKRNYSPEKKKERTPERKPTRVKIETITKFYFICPVCRTDNEFDVDVRGDDLVCCERCGAYSIPE